MCKLCMASIIGIGLIGLVLLWPSIAPAAGCGDHSAASHGHGPAVVSSQASGVGLCPVSGKPANPEYTLDIGSKSYSFCDKAHMDKFRARPLYYLKQLRAAEAKHGGGSAVASKKCCGTCDYGRKKPCALKSKCADKSGCTAKKSSCSYSSKSRTTKSCATKGSWMTGKCTRKSNCSAACPVTGAKAKGSCCGTCGGK